MLVVSRHSFPKDGVVDSLAAYQYPTGCSIGDPHPSDEWHHTSGHFEPAEHYNDCCRNKDVVAANAPHQSKTLQVHICHEALPPSGFFYEWVLLDSFIFSRVATSQQQMVIVGSRHGLLYISRAAPILAAECMTNFPQCPKSSLPETRGKGAPNTMNCADST